MQKIINFIKYNNATIIILALVLVLGGGALAAGPENIGQKQTSIQGVDNAALIAVDLEAFNMDFKIENVQADEKYYYVTYSFLDLVLADNLWQYQLSQKTQKVSRKIKEDIGIYMAKFMAKHHEARTRELKNEKSLAASAGEQKRVEVTEYSGLIGRTLNLAAAVFPGYEPVVKTELPTPENFNLPESINSGVAAPRGGTDNLTQIYNDYIAEHPEIFTTEAPVDTVDGTTDLITSTDTVVSETPVDPEASGILEPESVEIIKLPKLKPEAPAENAPEPEPAPVEPAQVPAEPAPAPAPVKSAPAPAPAPAPVKSAPVPAPVPEAPAAENATPTEPAAQ